MPTLLIDETSTAGERRILFHLLRTGTTRDTVALRRDESFKTFGAKVISWIELPDDAALNSRCVVIPLHETHRTDLTRSTNPDIQHAAEDLQRQFLQFRFEKFKGLKLPKVQGDEVLHSRARDLYEALALPIGEDPEICELLVGLFKTQQKSNREPLSRCQAAVLQTLFIGIHTPTKKGTIAIRYLTTMVNCFLRSNGDGFQISPRRVGAALTSLGLTDRDRTNTGWVLTVDRKAQEFIHELMAAYGSDEEIPLLRAESRQRCDFCTGIKEPETKK